MNQTANTASGVSWIRARRGNPRIVSQFVSPGWILDVSGCGLRSRIGSGFVGGPLIAGLVTPFAGGHFDTPNAVLTCFAGPCGAETIWAARHAVTTSFT